MVTPGRAEPLTTGLGLSQKLRDAQAEVLRRRGELEVAVRERDGLVVRAVDTGAIGYRALARLLNMRTGNIHRILTDSGSYRTRAAVET